MAFRVLVVYALLVFTGGTLATSGSPVLSELGLLMQTITLVDPAIGWADAQGYEMLSGGLRTLAGGIHIG